MLIEEQKLIAKKAVMCYDGWKSMVYEFQKTKVKVKTLLTYMEELSDVVYEVSLLSLLQHCL